MVLRARISPGSAASVSASCQPSLPNWKGPPASSCWIRKTGAPAALALALTTLIVSMTRSISKAAYSPTLSARWTSMIRSAVVMGVILENGKSRSLKGRAGGVPAQRQDRQHHRFFGTVACNDFRGACSRPLSYRGNRANPYPLPGPFHRDSPRPALRPYLEPRAAGPVR
ncbi:hypothetical protein D3C76_1231690 [compost metagenome]